MRLIDANAIPWTDLNDNPNSKIRVLITFADKVNRMPTIEERKTGKWIIEPYDLEHDIWAHRCGECLKVSMLGGKEKKFNFCPNCGAEVEKS